MASETDRQRELIRKALASIRRKAVASEKKEKAEEEGAPAISLVIGLGEAGEK